MSHILRCNYYIPRTLCIEEIAKISHYIYLCHIHENYLRCNILKICIISCTAQIIFIIYYKIERKEKQKENI